MLDLARQETVGATFALLVDSSGSMSRRLDFVQRTAGLLYDYMTPLDRAIIAPFAKNVLSITGPTDDRRTVADAIHAIGSGGGTAIVDSLIQMAHRFPESSGRRVIILITDGYDENSVSSVDDAIAAVKEARATVYSVAIGGVAGVSLKGEKVLRRLAAETGGRLFLPSTESQLELVHTALVDEVRNRYLLTYTPTNQNKDGKWRQITVQLPDPAYHVAARPGYFAPKPPPVRPTIEFTATDPDGAYLSISADDLEVVEDDVVQHVETFQEASQPVSIILALDASGSMRRREADVIASARAFVSALRPEDKVGIMLFADGVTLVQDLTTESHTEQRSHRQLQDRRRDGPLRCGVDSIEPTRAHRGPASDRRDDGRPRREQSGDRAGQHAHIRGRQAAVEGERYDDVRHRPWHQSGFRTTQGTGGSQRRASPAAPRCFGTGR